MQPSPDGGTSLRRHPALEQLTHVSPGRVTQTGPMPVSAELTRMFHDDVQYEP